MEQSHSQHSDLYSTADTSISREATPPHKSKLMILKRRCSLAECLVTKARYGTSGAGHSNSGTLAGIPIAAIITVSYMSSDCLNSLGSYSALRFLTSKRVLVVHYFGDFQ
jgi:hypothetical protein